jgi:hypothetical protein
MTTASSSSTAIYGSNSSCADMMNHGVSDVLADVSLDECVYLGGEYVKSTMTASGDELMSLAASTGGTIYPMMLTTDGHLAQFRYEAPVVGCATRSEGTLTSYVEYSCNRGK